MVFLIWNISFFCHFAKYIFFSLLIFITLLTLLSKLKLKQVFEQIFAPVWNECRCNTAGIQISIHWNGCKHCFYSQYHSKYCHNHLQCHTNVITTDTSLLVWKQQYRINLSARRIIHNSQIHRFISDNDSVCVNRIY